MRLTTILVLILIPFYFKSQEIIASINEIYPDKEFAKSFSLKINLTGECYPNQVN